MKNEKKFPYYIGVDIGTDSVGYAVTDTDYHLLKHGGQPMWGATLFEAANQCNERKSFRSARRRLNRRQQRVNLLQELFCKEISKVDDKFFISLKESSLIKENDISGCDWINDEYNKKYKTIHHLIVELMNSNEKHDIRYIYLACAWLIVHRGHFLNEIDGDSVEELTDIKPLYNQLMQWFDDNDYPQPWDCDIDEFSRIISENKPISVKEKEMYGIMFNGKKPADEPEGFPYSKSSIIKLLCGGSLNAKKLFLLNDDAESIEGSIALYNTEALEEAISMLGDDGELLIHMSRIFDCAVLSKILSGFNTISEVKVNEYETHKAELRELKYIIKKYCPNAYDDIFRDATGKGYSAYVQNYKSDKNKSDRSKLKRTSKEDFYKTIKSVLSKISTDNEADKSIISNILSKIEINAYMPKQVNSDNRVIPHQLYYSELKKILENAAVFYPFLNEKDEAGLTVSDKIKSIFLYRIPYFVGPLNRHSENSWIERKAEGKIYPWNFESIVDYDASELAFIKRMTNKCTYLPEKNVLAKNSLLYSKFTVLNEINNLKIDNKPVSVELKQNIFNDLFMPNGHNKSKVTRKAIINYLVSNSIIQKGEDNRISGIDTEIKSSLKPYFDFYKLMSSKKLSADDVERIIERSTYTESKSRFKKWIENNFNLDEDDIRYVSGKKYTGFGRLSKELLNELEGADANGEAVGTVIGIMWNTNDNFMQIIQDESRYSFKKQISDINEKYYNENKSSLNDILDDMGINNAVKRPILRTVEIMSDIVKAQKSHPQKIFVEMARGGRPEQKNKRTESRKNSLLNMYSLMPPGEVAGMIEELDKLGDDADFKLKSEKLFLYFLQNGRCMYCGEPIHLSELNTSEYNIDHIYPQAYVKDDSIHNNKVLVHSGENGLKSDSYPIDPSIQKRMTDFWKRLNKVTAGSGDFKLLNDEKLKRLTRTTPFTDEEKYGFINRQIVETRQATKAVAHIFEMLYPETEVVFVKAGIVSEFRHQFGEIKSHAFKLDLKNEEKEALEMTKCRSLNDVHHANDAYLNIVAGNVYHEMFTKKWYFVKNNYSVNARAVYGNEHESIKNVWEPKKHLPVVEKTMENKFIHLTKYQTVKKGGLFDQNPLPAGNSSLIPKKKGLDVMKYGGYNKGSATFFCLVKYKKGRKTEVTFLPVDLMFSEKFLNDLSYREEYVKDKLGDKISEISFPLKDRMLKLNTVLSLDGFLVCLAGKANGGKIIGLRSLMTCFVPGKYNAYAKKAEKVLEKLALDKNYIVNERYDKISKEKNEELFDYLMNKINSPVFSKMPGSKIVLGDTEKEKFTSLDIIGQLKCIQNLILYLKTNRAGSCDMSLVGGSNNSGVIYLSSNLSNWKYDDIRIVDRSASGIFETKSENLKELL